MRLTGVNASECNDATLDETTKEPEPSDESRRVREEALIFYEKMLNRRRR